MSRGLSYGLRFVSCSCSLFTDVSFRCNLAVLAQPTVQAQRHHSSIEFALRLWWGCWKLAQIHEARKSGSRIEPSLPVRCCLLHLNREPGRHRVALGPSADLLRQQSLHRNPEQILFDAPRDGRDAHQELRDAPVEKRLAAFHVLLKRSRIILLESPTPESVSKRVQGLGAWMRPIFQLPVALRS